MRIGFTGCTFNLALCDTIKAKPDIIGDGNVKKSWFLTDESNLRAEPMWIAGVECFTVKFNCPLLWIIKSFNELD